jgi:hypothetical protein
MPKQLGARGFETPGLGHKLTRASWFFLGAHFWESGYYGTKVKNIYKKKRIKNPKEMLKSSSRLSLQALAWINVDQGRSM